MAKYTKRGKTSRVTSKGDIKRTYDERLANRMLLTTEIGPVDPLQRAMGIYALEPRELSLPTVPRRGTDGQDHSVTEVGVASRGNVTHGRYLKGIV